MLGVPLVRDGVFIGVLSLTHAGVKAVHRQTN